MVAGKTLESVLLLGPLFLERAYDHCSPCQSGFCPRDRHRLEMFSLTPGVWRMTASTAALGNFVESSSLLRELAGVEVGASQVERAAEALGAEIAADEHKGGEPAGDTAPTRYLGMDGTGVPMRNSKVADRAGKQPDGSAKTREAKVVTIWTAESRDSQIAARFLPISEENAQKQETYRRPASTGPNRVSLRLSTVLGYHHLPRRSRCY